MSDVPRLKRLRDRRLEALARSRVAFDARRQAIREEVACAITHGAGLLLAVAAVPVLITLAVLNGSMLHVTAFSLYGSTLVLLYAASTLYHAFREPRVKRVLRIVDHAAIYLLIAGTYTPVALVSLDGPISYALLGGIWTLAFIGIVFKAFFFGRFVRLSVVFYLAMGWMAVLVLEPVLAALPLAACLWLLAGGLFYTGGVVFFAWERLPYNHAVWHLFVLGGSICHFLAIARYVW